jgi:hypothetical protein
MERPFIIRAPLKPVLLGWGFSMAGGPPFPSSIRMPELGVPHSSRLVLARGWAQVSDRDHSRVLRSANIFPLCHAASNAASRRETCTSSPSVVYRCASLLGTTKARHVFEQTLERVRCWYDFYVVGSVVMPEHVHLLVSEPERSALAVCDPDAEAVRRTQSFTHPVANDGRQGWGTRT